MLTILKKITPVTLVAKAIANNVVRNNSMARRNDVAGSIDQKVEAKQSRINRMIIGDRVQVLTILDGLKNEKYIP